MEQVSNKTSKETIETLQQTIEDYRDGADPNDDLTMMCMRLERKI